MVTTTRALGEERGGATDYPGLVRTVGLQGVAYMRARVYEAEAHKLNSLVLNLPLPAGIMEGV